MSPNPEPLTNPKTGKPLPQREQPGYYPKFSTMGQKAYWDAATRKVVVDRVQNIPELKFFTPEEATTLTAVIERVLPQDDRMPSRRVPILPAIDRRQHLNEIPGYRYADMPPDREAFRVAIQAFEQMGRELYDQPFHELSVRQQEEILQSVHDEKPKAAKELWKKMNVSRFWSLLMSDCTGVYYAHPWAWDEIGFGGPAYPRAYMRLEEGQPEPWEVNERRYEWNAPADTLSDNKQPEKSGEHQTQPGQGGTH